MDLGCHCSDTDTVPVCRDEERAECESEAAGQSSSLPSTMATNFA